MELSSSCKSDRFPFAVSHLNNPHMHVAQNQVTEKASVPPSSGMSRGGICNLVLCCLHHADTTFSDKIHAHIHFLTIVYCGRVWVMRLNK